MAQTYTVKQGDTLNGIAQGMGYKNYQEAGFAMPKSGNYDLIMPGETLNYSGKNNLITTSTKARNETEQKSNALDGILSGMGNQQQQPQNGDGTVVSDPMTQLLDNMDRTSNDSSRALIASIRTARQNNANSINQQYDAYKRGLQLLGIQTNMTEATPDILLSHINSAENDHRAKIQNLDAETAKAVMEAENARNDKNLSLFKERMSYVDKLKKEKQDVLKNLYEQITATKGISDTVAGWMYDKMQGLSTQEQEKLIQETAKKYGVPVNSIIGAISQIKRDRYFEDTKLSNSSKKSSSSDNLDLTSILNEEGDTTINNTGDYTLTNHQNVDLDGMILTK
jgi:hypothetical protein